MNDIIRVENLVKRYKKAEGNAVDGVSFQIQEGEFFALLGPNGAGKTTTISILTTTLSPSEGRVEVCGFNVVEQAAEVRSRVGIIFQNASLDLNLTAEENIRFHAVLYGVFPFAPSFKMMHKDYQKRVEDLAEVVDLKADLFKPVRNFSGGMRRKLEIIRSLMHNPKVLFLDEPTVGLDPLSRRHLWDYLVDVRKRDGLTVFLTTHYLEEAEDVDRVCIINHGKIQFLDSPEALKSTLATQKHVRLDSDDRAKLLKELEMKQIRFVVEDYVKVGFATADEAHQIIKSVETPLTLLDVHAPTLEEAYLEVISK